jgi:putative RecB family exonuclease
MIGVPLRPRSPPPQTFTRDYLSYSSISTYRRCPLAFYFKYFAQLPERTVSSSRFFGSAVHQAIEYFFNEMMSGGEPPSLEALLGEYDRHWQTIDVAAVKFGKGEGRESLGELARRMLVVFQASDFAKSNGRILGVEEELRGSLVPNTPDFLGRLDLVVETDDAVVVTDLKTARSRWSSTQVEESSEQLLLYHELVKPFVPTKSVRLRFAVLTKTKTPSLDLHEVPVDLRRIDRVKRIVERVWRAIEARTFYPAPSPLNCPTCPFRRPCRDWMG